MSKQEKNITIEGLAKKVDNLTENVDSLAVAVAKGFYAVDRRFEKLENKFHGRFKSLEDGQEEIKLRLDNVPYRFEMKELEKRVSFIEKKTGIHYC